MSKQQRFFVGRNSIIRGDVIIGEGSKVWHNCNLYGCRIGRNTQIGSYTEIKEGVVIGDDCRMQSYIFIPESTRIGNGVFLGPRVTFLNDKYPTSRKAIEKTWELEAAVVEDLVTIGGGALILPGIVIRTMAFIGAGSVVTKDVGEREVWYGNPAKKMGFVDDTRYRGLIK